MDSTPYYSSLDQKHLEKRKLLQQHLNEQHQESIMKQYNYVFYLSALSMIIFFVTACTSSTLQLILIIINGILIISNIILNIVLTIKARTLP